MHASQVDRLAGTALRIVVLSLSCHAPLSTCLVTNPGPACIGNLGRPCADVLWHGHACRQLMLFCTRAVYDKSTMPVESKTGAYERAALSLRPQRRTAMVSMCTVCGLGSCFPCMPVHWLEPLQQRGVAPQVPAPRACGTHRRRVHVSPHFQMRPPSWSMTFWSRRGNSLERPSRL